MGEPLGRSVGEPVLVARVHAPRAEARRSATMPIAMGASSHHRTAPLSCQHGASGSASQRVKLSQRLGHS